MLAVRCGANRVTRPAGPRGLWLLALVVAASGCGGNEHAPASPSPPQLPADTAFPDPGLTPPLEPPAAGQELSTAPIPAPPRAPSTAILQDKSQPSKKALEGIGYVGGTERPTTNDLITVHDRRRTFAGINFFTSGHGPEALLMDMEGRILHRWRYPFEKAWPELPAGMSPERGYEHEYKDHFRRAHLFTNGNLLGIFDGFGLLKLDKHSNLIWARLNRAHHDLQVLPNGEIHVITHRGHVIPWVHETQEIFEDFITVLDAQGNEKKRVSLLDCLRNSGFQIDRSRIVAKDRIVSILHTNTLEVLDGRPVNETRRLSDPAALIAGQPWMLSGYRWNPFRQGNVLTSIRASDLIAVVDPDIEKVVWAMKGIFKQQHEPTLLENGNLLLFDNLGHPDRSSVLEFRPFTGEVTWLYRGAPEHPFFSKTCGTASRLPNGNTLITDSNRGRAFEVTPSGEIVWEYYNPARTGENDEYVAMIYEMVRLPPDFPLAWLED
ncbi:MAG: arylsulfotransferase family protein [Planctomycetota bacterium]